MFFLNFPWTSSNVYCWLIFIWKHSIVFISILKTLTNFRIESISFGNHFRKHGYRCKKLMITNPFVLALNDVYHQCNLLIIFVTVASHTIVVFNLKSPLLLLLTTNELLIFKWRCLTHITEFTLIHTETTTTSTHLIHSISNFIA